MSSPRPRLAAPVRIAAGIFSSRVFGLVREVGIAAVFGAGAHADVFGTVLRGPNVLQNLLGEQTLSASFIPVYSRMLEEGREEEAGRFAGAVFGLLLAVAAGFTLVGILAARPLVTLLAPGFLADAARVAAGTAALDRFPLAVSAVRLIFPMTGLLVLSAWSLGVLNSHRRFFLPYFAPVLWNAAIIAALAAAAAALVPDGLAGIGPDLPTGLRSRLLLAACWGALAGGLLQFLVQLPLVSRVLRGFRLSLSTRVRGVREALRAFAPLVAARGVLQLSGYLDQVLASLLAAGAVAGLRWAYILYLLPVSLFAMSVAAAELPELSRRSGEGEGPEVLERARAGLRRIAFLVLPTLVGYLAFGWLLIAALFRRGNFGTADTWLVYLTLCALAVGLIAASWSRMLQNVFYSRGETRAPARIAMLRVGLSVAAGAFLMLVLDRYTVGGSLGFDVGERDLHLGAAGLALAGGLAAWLELSLLRRALARLLPGPVLPWRTAGKLSAAALLCAAPATALWRLLPAIPTLAAALLVTLSYALLYLVLARRLCPAEARFWLGRLAGRRGSGAGEGRSGGSSR